MMTPEHMKRGVINPLEPGKLPNSLTWTTEQPTKPGWYWWRDSEASEAQVVRVCVADDDVLGLRAETVNWDCLVCECDGEWAGPIEEPKEGL